MEEGARGDGWGVGRLTEPREEVPRGGGEVENSTMVGEAPPTGQIITGSPQTGGITDTDEDTGRTGRLTCSPELAGGGPPTVVAIKKQLTPWDHWAKLKNLK